MNKFEVIFPLVSFRKLEHILGFSRAYLNMLASRSGRMYSSFDMRPRNSKKKWRHIDNPDKVLREVQKRFYSNVLCRYPFPETMVGGVTGGSILKNASYHVGQRFVYAIDLRACFPNTDNISVYNAYIKKLGCSPKIASLLSKLTTFHRRVPQGAPTSPAITNLVLLDLHKEVSEIARKNGLNLSFYIDDIVFSGDNVKESIEPIIQTVQKYGYAVSNSKKNQMPASGPQVVTGLLVNRKVNIQKDYIYKLKADIFSKKSEGIISETEQQALRGKINFIRQINPDLANKIEEWFDNMELTLFGMKNETKNEYRKCRCAKRHRHFKQNNAGKHNRNGLN
jgi:RNA-directed DNA polymerase